SQPRAWLAALWPLVPAGLLALWFKFFFITPPGTLGGGWWMSADAGAVLGAVRDVFAWDELLWLSDAAARHAPGEGWPVLLLAGAAALVATVTAWGRRQSDPLVGPLLG